MKITRPILLTFIAIILAGVLVVQFYLRQGEQAADEKIWKVGFLLTDKDVQSDNMSGFKDGMAGNGYLVGQSVEYVEKNAGPDRKLMDVYAKELNEAGLDIVVVGASSAAQAFQKLEGLKTPVYFLAAGRPRDIVKNLRSPEGLITGIGEGTIEFEGKRLELLKETAPGIKKVIAIVESKHPNAKFFKEKVEEAAKTLGLQMVYFEIEKTDDLPGKLPMVNRQNGDAFIGGPWPSNQKYAKEMAAHFLKAKIPSINDETSVGANIGFLLTYSDDRYKTGRYAAEHVDRLLRGMVPVSSVPVEFAKDTLLEINLGTAQELGISVPDKILLRASKSYKQ